VTDADTGKRSWQILAVVLTGSFMAVLDTGITGFQILDLDVPTRQMGSSETAKPPTGMGDAGRGPCYNG
jgi:hypothetical protein